MSEDELIDIWGRAGRRGAEARVQVSSSLFQLIKEQERWGRSQSEDLSVRMLPSNNVPPANESKVWDLVRARGWVKWRGGVKGHHHSQLCGAACHQRLSWCCCPDCLPPQPLRDRNKFSDSDVMHYVVMYWFSFSEEYWSVVMALCWSLTFNLAFIFTQ